MSFTYRYTGDVPTVFVSLEKDGATWTAKPGDAITVDGLVGHPLLTRVKDVPDEKVPEKVAKPVVAVTAEATPEPKTS